MAANDPKTAAGTRRIGVVQRRCQPDPDRNLSAARDAIADAVREAADFLFYIDYIDRDRLAIRRGATVDQAQARVWQTIRWAHAIANEIFVFAVNREGHETQGGPRARAFDFGADPC